MADLIDRQAAVDAAKHAWAKGLEPSQYIEIIQPVQPEMTDEQFEDYCRKRCLSVVTNEFMYEVRKMVPTVRPKHGKWIDTETSYADGVQQKCQCSVCARLSPRPLGDFCRWCGADMRGGVDG